MIVNYFDISDCSDYFESNLRSAFMLGALAWSSASKFYSFTVCADLWNVTCKQICWHLDGKKERKEYFGMFCDAQSTNMKFTCYAAQSTNSNLHVMSQCPATGQEF